MNEKYVVAMMNFLKRNKVVSVLLLVLIIAISGALLSNKNASEIAIELLRGSKRISGGQEQFAPATNTPQVSNKLWDTLLKEHVDAFGMVNYQGVMQDSKN